MTLLKLIARVLKENQKTIKDILWCGNETFGWFKWEDFEKLAKHRDESVAEDLKIVGKDFWIEEVDHGDNGNEWEFKTMPIKPVNYNKPMALTRSQSEKLGIESCYKPTLENLNRF